MCLSVKENNMRKVYSIGDRIKAVKHGVDMEGIVTDLRAAYGGVRVQYTVKLDTPVQYRWRPGEMVDTILVYCNEVETRA